MKITRRTATIGLALSTFIAGYGPSFGQSMDELEAAARKEGTIVSLGCPDDWANWGDQWKAITAKYGVTHTDTDMSSAEELAKFEAEKNNPSADIGEVGLEFGPIAAAKGISQPYKTTNWDKIPAWAKDADGHWALGYTGTIAFIISKKVQNPPKSFADLANGDYKVAVGDVGKAAQSNALVLAAAIAGGGAKRISSPRLICSPNSPSRSACSPLVPIRPTWKRARSKSASCGTSTRSTIATSWARTSSTC